VNQWTVVLKAVAGQNSTGEWPYMVRADSREQAIDKAIEAHEARYPRWAKVQRILEVIEWPYRAAA
jgi:uncharacterized protein YfbU (UPF0304 family)